MSRAAVLVRRTPATDGDSGAEAETPAFVIDESLGYLVNRAARLMAAELAERLRPAGIGIGQWAIMLLLWAGDGATQAELARLAAIEPPTVVRTIDRMVRDGLVTRAPDANDARLSRIHLTERGRTLRDELVPKAVAVNDVFLQRLTPSEGANLRRLLTKLVANPSRP
jgi:DNA-binding MarR family transcriptional regulator